MNRRVAVVGMDCRFPGADGTDAYWQLLMRGAEAIRPLPPHRHLGNGFDATALGGFLDDADLFDHTFFSVSPREAAAMDPQQRLLLQCAWRALEDSGCAPARTAKADTGVFVGVMGSEWAQLHLGGPARITPQLGPGSSTGMTANRISYHLDLKGPSLAVDTACSSSLVAVHLAVNSLLSGECSTALAAGVNLVLAPALGEVYRQLGLAAPDGRCKPFSADADGIGRGDGAGVVVLRRLDDALADRQRIYAVIDGTAVNQDGRSNGVTAPSRWSQRDVVAAACRRAGIAPEQVGHVEAHGTGTILGDLIECAALGELHAVPRAKACAIGSVKGNLGHTEGAAGIAGLIKTALALHHRIVPAGRHTARENPRLRLAERGLRLLKAPERLPAGPAFAGVSSFGMGGTNAHAVLSTAPRPHRVPSARRPQRAPAVGVFTVSADTPDALRRNLAAQAGAVARAPRGDAAALCWSSNRVKTGLAHRAAFVAEGTASLAAALRTAAAAPLPDSGACGGRPPLLGLLVDGRGAPLPGTTARLYEESPLYRERLDRADAALLPHLGCSVRELLLSGGGGTDVRRREWAGPAQFAVGLALSETLAGLGAAPGAARGLGRPGAYAAAVASGTLDLAEAAARLASPPDQDGPPDHGWPADDAPDAPDVPDLAALVAEHAPTAFLVLGPQPAPLPGAAPPDGPPPLHLAPGPGTGLRELAAVLAELYRAGHELDWDGLYPPERRRPERLAPYAFSTEHRFWRTPAFRDVQQQVVRQEAPQPATDPRTPGAGPHDPVLALVVEAVAEVGAYEPGRLGPGTRFYEDLAFDSVMTLQLKDRLETVLPQAAGVTVQQLLPELRSLGSLAAFLNEWTGVGPGAEAGVSR